MSHLFAGGERLLNSGSDFFSDAKVDCVQEVWEILMSNSFDLMMICSFQFLFP